MTATDRIRARKGQGGKIVCLTAYTTPVARILDAHCDLLLVGDSVGMVLYGMESTQGVTMDMMIRHGQAARRGCNAAVLVVDMPYGSYEQAQDAALANARRIMDETGADAVKLEGGADQAPTIAALTQDGIPVMAHIGLLPQSVAPGEAYRVQGKTPEDAARLLADARAVADAGAFCVVIECTKADIARDVSAAVAIPTIGIGASAACDGQILVTDDMLGMNARVPKFVKTYAQLGTAIADAAARYAAEVRSGAFPADEHTYK